VRVTTFPPDMRQSNHNRNPFYYKQYAIVNIQLNIVTCRYLDKFIRHMLLHRLSTTLGCNCQTATFNLSNPHYSACKHLCQCCRR